LAEAPFCSDQTFKAPLLSTAKINSGLETLAAGLNLKLLTIVAGPRPSD
jgi:hypothetical protein